MGQDKRSVRDRATYSYSSDWIHTLEKETHWRLYWRQQRLLESRIESDDSILEIGVGSGFTAKYLRSRGFQVTTLDIDEEKKPDIVSNVVTFEPHRKYDHVLAFEVFEHMPFDDLARVMQNFSGKIRKYLFISVPLYRRLIASVKCRIPKLGKIGEFEIRLTLPKRQLTSAHHHWELGYHGTDEEALRETLARFNLKLEHQEEAFSIAFLVFKKVQRQEQ
jgi:uncharacterized UPF0146 family protein